MESELQGKEAKWRGYCCMEQAMAPVTRRPRGLGQKGQVKTDEVVGVRRGRAGRQGAKLCTPPSRDGASSAEGV